MGHCDYVVGEVNPHAIATSPPLNSGIGRMIEVTDGALIVGAFGQRCATLEAVGDWHAIGDDLQRGSRRPRRDCLGKSPQNPRFCQRCSRSPTKAMSWFPTRKSA